MKRKLKILILLLIVFNLTGCYELNEDNLKEGTPLVIIIGKHANANIFTEIPDELSKLIEESLDVTDNGEGYSIEANVSIIINDGNPTRENIGINLSNSTREYNQKDLEYNINKIKNKIESFILSNEIIATDEETDLIASLSEAESILDDEPKSNIYIYDSGITTSGYLNMVDNKNDISKNEISEIVNRLEKKNVLPSLTGVNVTFEGLLNVADPQMSESPLKKLIKNLWEEIISKSGATLTKIDVSEKNGKPMVYNEDESGETVYPYVTPVTFSGLDAEDDVHIYPSTQLGFKPGSSEFRDGKALAVKAIEDLQLESLNKYVENEDGYIYVVGSIAKTSQDIAFSSNEISKERGEKVADILVELGIPSSRIKVIDAGTTVFSWRNKEEFPNGIKSDENQQGNRVVAIIPDSYKNTNKIQELKENGYIE